MRIVAQPGEACIHPGVGEPIGMKLFLDVPRNPDLADVLDVGGRRAEGHTVEDVGDGGGVSRAGRGGQAGRTGQNGECEAQEHGVTGRVRHAGLDQPAAGT